MILQEIILGLIILTEFWASQKRIQGHVMSTLEKTSTELLIPFLPIDDFVKRKSEETNILKIIQTAQFYSEYYATYFSSCVLFKVRGNGV